MSVRKRSEGEVHPLGTSFKVGKQSQNKHYDRKTEKSACITEQETGQLTFSPRRVARRSVISMKPAFRDSWYSFWSVTISLAFRSRASLQVDTNSLLQITHIHMYTHMHVYTQRIPSVPTQNSRRYLWIRSLPPMRLLPETLNCFIWSAKKSEQRNMNAHQTQQQAIQYLSFVCLFLQSVSSRIYLFRQLYMLPHNNRNCRSNLLSHPVMVYWHPANQF